jgi:hypothetical protein
VDILIISEFVCEVRVTFFVDDTEEISGQYHRAFFRWMRLEHQQGFLIDD